MNKNKENLNAFFVHFLDRLNNYEPNETKIMKLLVDFCNYYSFRSGFVYQTDGFRYFLLKETIGNENNVLRPRFEMNEMTTQHADYIKVQQKPLYIIRGEDTPLNHIDILNFYEADSLLIRQFKDTDGKIIGFIGFAGMENEKPLTDDDMLAIHLILGSFTKEIAIREYKEREVRASNTLSSIMNNWELIFM